jgi:hypothetical protein
VVGLGKFWSVWESFGRSGKVLVGLGKCGRVGLGKFWESVVGLGKCGRSGKCDMRIIQVANCCLVIKRY